MRQAFVFDNIAVLVFPWNEPMDPPERGARVEVRLLEHEPARGTAVRAPSAWSSTRPSSVPISSMSSASRSAISAARTSIPTSTGSNRAIATGAR